MSFTDRRQRITWPYGQTTEDLALMTTPASWQRLVYIEANSHSLSTRLVCLVWLVENLCPSLFRPLQIGQIRFKQRKLGLALLLYQFKLVIVVTRCMHVRLKIYPGFDFHKKKILIAIFSMKILMTSAPENFGNVRVKSTLRIVQGEVSISRLKFYIRILPENIQHSALSREINIKKKYW